MKEDPPSLKYAQRVQIHNYFLSLRRFFDITGGSHDRSMTSRAQKARSKLLKLSSSQFFELSTDVNDELQRRIDESQSQHQFLMPNENFHAKRNQARQKLANLSDVRFNDLVDDILYEIKRRGFDQKPDNRTSLAEDEQDESLIAEKNGMSTPALNIIKPMDTPVVTSPKSLDAASLDENSASNTILQTSKVIPKTASIDWSSEEEDEREDVKEYNKELSEKHNEKLASTIDRGNGFNSSPLTTASTFGPSVSGINSPPLSKSTNSLNNRFSFTERPLSQSSGTNTPLNELNSASSNKEANSSPNLNHHRKMNSLSHSIKRNKDRDIELLVSEGNKLDETISNLEKEKASLLANLAELKLSNEKLKTENESLYDQLENLKQSLPNLDTTKALDNNFQKGMTEMTSQLNELSIENEELKQRNLEMQLQLKNISSPVKTKELFTEREDNTWRLKYERLLSSQGLAGNSAFSPITNKTLFPPQSVISSNLIDDLDSQFGKFFILLKEENVSVQKLFENVASISDYCLRISNAAHTPETKTGRALLQNTLSHAITSVRYFCTYKTPLLKFILQNSISEISFAIYDLVKLVNLGPESLSSTSSKSIENPDFIPEASTPATPYETERNNSFIDEQPLEKPSIYGLPNSVEMSPVKPLKITQKKNSDEKINRPYSNRKPSGPGLFTAMINGGQKKDNSLAKRKNKLDLVLPETGNLIAKKDDFAATDNEATSPISKNIVAGINTYTLEDLQSRENSNVIITEPIASPIPLETVSPVSPQISSNVVGVTAVSPPLSISYNKAKVLQSLNSDMYNDDDDDDDEVTESESIDDDNSTYEALKQTMKSKHLQEEEKNNSVFNPITHPQPIDPVIEDDLNEKPFNFESSDDKSNEIETNSVQPVSLNKIDVKLVPVPSSTPVNQIFDESEKAYLIVSPLKPVSRQSILFDNTTNEDRSNLRQSIQASQQTKEDIKEEESEEEESEFDVDAFDIENPDNSLSDLLLYLEYQTMDVINTIQSLLSSIKVPNSTAGELRTESNAINQVIRQMVEATSVSMNQSRNATLKEHGSWVVQSLDDCRRRMTILCHLKSDGEMTTHEGDDDFADKHFKQRLAGIAFDVAKCTKELVKTVEEASLKNNIEYLNAKLSK